MNSIDSIQKAIVDYVECDFLITTNPVGINDASIPSGARALFVQSLAPTGWTKVTTAAFNSAAIIGIANNTAPFDETGVVAGFQTSANPSGQNYVSHNHAAPAHVHTQSHYHLAFQNDWLAHRHYLSSDFAHLRFTAPVNVSTIQQQVQATDIPQQNTSSNNDSLSPVGFTSGSVNVKYFNVILATKD